MPRIGVTGHQRLVDPSAWPWVDLEISKVLRGSHQRVIGLTSLAMGADQVFAEVVLRNGGDLVVILPFPEYELVFPEVRERQRFHTLLARASSIEVLERKETEEEAYLVAGKRVIDESDRVIAVWDGEPAGGRGGTADIVCYAVSQRKPVIHINPNRRTVEIIDRSG
jgi:hypothetical protein